MNARHQARLLAVSAAVFAAGAVTTPVLGAGAAGGSGAATVSAGASGGAAASSGGSPAAGTSGYQNGSVFLRPLRRTLYVLVFGPDAATTNYVAYEVSLLLGSTVYYDTKKHTKGSWRMTTPNAGETEPQWVLPEPSWTLGDFATQCQNDPEHTAGALVLYDLENDSGSFSWLLLQNTYTHLYAKAALIRCRSQFKADAPSASLRTVDALQASTLVNTGPAGSPVETSSVQLTTVKSGQVTDQKAVTSSTPPPTATTKTLTQTAIPQMDIVWQNTDMLSGHRLQRSVPFLAFAGLVTYLATRYTVPTTTTSSTTLPSPIATGGTVTSGTSRTYNGATDLPLSLAVLGSTIGGLSSSSVGGANQSRVLKNAAAALATRLMNLWSDECRLDSAGKVACTDIDDLKLFNIKSITEYSIQDRAEATKP